MIQLESKLSLTDASIVEELATYTWCLVKELDTQNFYVIRGFFENEAEALHNWNDLKLILSSLTDDFSLTPVQDKDWKEAYKVNLKPWSYGPLHWIPSWMKNEYVLPHNAVPVYIDAGMAFGTGAHETTRLCAQRLVDLAQSGIKGSLVDAGCGSGILSLSASKLGFGPVFGFDIDPEAVCISQENLALNAPANVHYSTANLEEGLRNSRENLNVIVANIQADVLCNHASLLAQCLKKSTVLILSGILNYEIASVKNTFEQALSEQSVPCEFSSQTLGEWADLQITHCS